MQETLVGEWRDETEKGRKPGKGVLSEAVTTMGTWIDPETEKLTTQFLQMGKALALAIHKEEP